MPRSDLRKYSDAIALWSRRYDTYEIGKLTGLPEAVVARWVANFRDLMTEAA